MPPPPRLLATALALALALSGARGATAQGEAGGAGTVTSPPAAGTAEAAQGVITAARFAEPTERYDHGILGDALEWGALVLTLRMADGSRAQRRIRLPRNRVFEDLAPRLAQVDGRPGPEVIVVETDLALGARLSVYGAGGLRAATPFIGRTHRWLAPIGAADLDGDGAVELAYVEKPHLSRVLKVWRWDAADERLVAVAEGRGFTNHRIGQRFISGGIRECGGVPEMIVADADWQRVMAVALRGGALTARAVGRFEGRDSFDKALSCQ